ncbi:MAG: NAD-dependent DNA ligase LigA [Deltaproteobacteria bacterium]|nr:NAD-dependent DNA ligase LigA [Deltaproteobacteria bacterium]
MASPAQIAESSAALKGRLPGLDVTELESLVRHHNALYWEQDEPEIDDPTFDKLVEALRARAPSSKALEELGESATKKKGQGFGDVVHLRPMLSLDKCYDDDTLLKWGDSFKGRVVVTPKIDGLACSIRYDKNGTISVAGTRGDGKTGDSILANVKGVKDIPHVLMNAPAASKDGLEIRGEVYMRVSRFNSTYKGDKSNPRNLAAGALKTKDPLESAAYGLSFFAYDLLGADLKEVASESEKHKALQSMGFPVMPLELIENHKELPDVFRRFVDVCKGLDVETDGVVMKADLLAEQDRLGATAHHPRYALAYKFQGESAQSVVTAIEWGVARTGTVNPVCVIEPVFVGGVTITRLSLHNPGYARKLGIGVGARVEITRRGGVIPHVERVLSPPTQPLVLPTEWPVRGGRTPLRAEGDFLYLQEPERCVDVVVARVGHFTKVIDATGFGGKRLLQLIEAGLVAQPADLYALDKKTLAALDRMGDISAQNLLDEMNARRAITLPVFLTALGIDDCGPTVAETLAENFHSLEAVRALSVKELSAVHGIGDTTAASLVNGLLKSAPLIDALLQQVTIVEKEKVEDSGSPLFGKSVVFTGSMAKMDRKTAQKKVQAAGGKTPSSVTADLDFLVIGDEGSALIAGGEKSTKHKAADKLIAKGSKVKIISETDFISMLGA